MHGSLEDLPVEVEVVLEPDLDAFRRLLTLLLGPDDDDGDDGPVAA